jgi:capsular polysaccharide transport system permease protein
VDRRSQQKATSSSVHSKSKIPSSSSSLLRCSMLDVRCSMFNNPSSSSLETENLNLEPHTPCSFWESLMIQKRVISALLMREILTRYGRHNIGFLWLFAEPMIFTLGVTVLWNAMNHHTANGISITEFVLTGYSTILLWRNMPNRCVGSIQPNLSLLYHRQVKPFDIIISRIILEFSGATISLIFLCFIFCTSNLINGPVDYFKTITGWILLSWFSASFSLLISSFTERSESIERLWHPVTYFFLPISGSLFMVTSLPEKIQDLALLIPTVNCIELFRAGFFGPIHHWHYDIKYVVITNSIITLFALAELKNMSKFFLKI